MILRLFRRPPRDDTIASLYGAIVAQARLSIFYRNYGVPDTVNGRFELVVLHAALLLRRLDVEAANDRALGQDVFDLFCHDMDANMREMGVGDIAVPRKMRAIGEAFYGRRRAYEATLALAENSALAAALARNVYGSPDQVGPGACRLAAYVRATDDELAGSDMARVRQGKLAFPDPMKIAADGGEK